MRILRTLRNAFFVAVGVVSPAIAGADELAGPWIVRWENSPKNENTISLVVAAGRLSGTYTNDDKMTCAVTGNVDEGTREMALSIICLKWDIRMQGRASTSWNRVSGDYQAYVNTKGIFSMRKN